MRCAGPENASQTNEIIMTLLHALDKNTLTADQLLSLDSSQPEALFSSNDPDIVKKEYRTLAKIWHSDRNTDPRAKDIMQLIQGLHEKALDKIKTGTWETPNLLRFETVNGKKYQIHYLKKHSFELGDVYIADASITYRVRKDESALFQNAKNIITQLNYPNSDMEKRLKPILPQIKYNFETRDHLLMVLDKDPDAVLLSDLVAHHNGKVPSVHAAWMISRLHNLGCYLDWAKLTHNALTTENCLVTPKDHRLTLVGGWWYARKNGDKLLALPPKTSSIAPPSLFDNPIAHPRLDLALIRATGREILGDATGMNLVRDTSIPKPITTWVNGLSSGDPREDYRLWSDEILTQSFGARRFVEMNITPNDIYKP
jgi:hypothetical protein